MTRRILRLLALTLVAALVLPPLWYAIRKPTPPELPPPGRRVELAGGIGVNVVEAGDGPPVVLVHGLPGSAYDWRVLVPALAARGLHAIAYDRVGYGRSDARRDDAFTVQSNARELVALLEALDLRGATIVGWSYGGATAIVAAGLDPSRMSRLVLVGSAGPPVEGDAGPPPLAARVLFSAPVMAWLAAVPPVSNGLRAALSVRAFSEKPQPEWWLPSLAANFAMPGTRRAYRAEMVGFGDGANLDPSGIALPVLVIHGDDDRLVPIAVGRALARLAPNARLVEVPGGSHMLPVTNAELLADEIARGAPGDPSGPRP